jgi:tetratricopeptide (TPR) repeat protein
MSHHLNDININDAIYENLNFEFKEGEIIDEISLANRIKASHPELDSESKDFHNNGLQTKYPEWFKDLDNIDVETFTVGMKLLEKKQIQAAELYIKKAKSELENFILKLKRSNNLFNSKSKKNKKKVWQSKLMTQEEYLEIRDFAKWTMTHIDAGIGDCNFEKKNWQKAKKYYEKALEYPDVLTYSNNDPSPYYKMKLGICEFELGNYKDARIYFRDTISAQGSKMFKIFKFNNYLEWWSKQNQKTIKETKTEKDTKEKI